MRKAPSASLGKDCNRAAGRFVGEPARVDDGPTQVALAERLLAGSLVLDDRRLVFDVLTLDEVRDLRRVTSRLNAGLIPETNLGPLARRTRANALRRSS